MRINPHSITPPPSPTGADALRSNTASDAQKATKAAQAAATSSPGADGSGPPTTEAAGHPAAPNAQARSNLASGDITIIENAFRTLEGVDPNSVGWKTIARAVTQDPTRSGPASVVAGALMNGPSGLTPDQRIQYGHIVSAAKKGDHDTAVSQFERFATEHGKNLPMDISSLVQHVLRDTYTDNVQDLRGFAEKVKHFNDQKEQVRNYMKAARTANVDEDLILRLEGQLNQAGEDAQLANVDMQNYLQKQQQALQMMANMAKSMNDTAMSVIRKIS